MLVAPLLVAAVLAQPVAHRVSVADRGGEAFCTAGLSDGDLWEKVRARVVLEARRSDEGAASAGLVVSLFHGVNAASPPSIPHSPVPDGPPRESRRPRFAPKIDPSGTRSTVRDVSTSELAASTPSDTSLDSLSRTAGDSLRRVLASSAGSVLSTQVEEDLRSALTGLEALHSHLEDLVSTLLEPRPTPLALVEAADDARAQQALVSLEETLTSLRRRLSQAAAQLRVRPAS